MLIGFVPSCAVGESRLLVIITGGPTPTGYGYISRERDKEKVILYLHVAILAGSIIS